MSLFTNKRAAAIGMAGALALGTVASVGSMTSADAASAATQYACVIMGNTVPLSVVGDVKLPSSVPSGSSLAKLPATMDVTLPAVLVGQLATALGITSLGGTTTDAALPMGAAGSIPLSALTIASTPVSSPTAALPLHASGATGAATAPAPGSYAVTMPKSFTFNPTSNSPVPLPPVSCTLPAGTAPAALGTLVVTQSSTTSKAVSKVALKLKNAPITTSKHAKLLAIVTAAGKSATGKVVAKEGTKTLASGTLTSGRKTLLLPKLKKGAHTIKVLYKGNATTKASSKKISFTVKKG
jgi:Family of unknown function (DUF6801)/Bacterial Ig-like domain (group 3)